MSSRIVDIPGAADSDSGALTPGLVVLDGYGTGVADIVRLADGAARPVPGTEAMKRVEESWDAARRIAATGRVYGRSTGVGANRNEDVPTEAAADHGLRLLRSHAGAIGEELPARQVRAMLAVRANQLLAGGAGLRPTVVTALCEALESGAYPVVNEFGSVGTGDIAALAQVGLALAGEHPWRGPGADGRPAARRRRPRGAAARQQRRPRPDQQQRPHPRPGRARPARAARARSRPPRSSPRCPCSPWTARTRRTRRPCTPPARTAASAEVARRMRELIGAADRPTPPLGRIQDPYGFRCLPQIHGPAHDAADALEEVLAVEINAAAENPLISAEDMAAYHHGGFYQAATRPRPGPLQARPHPGRAAVDLPPLHPERARVHPAAPLPRRPRARRPPA